MNKTAFDGYIHQKCSASMPLRAFFSRKGMEEQY